MSTPRLRRFGSATTMAALAAGSLVVSAIVAFQDPVPRWELRLTESLAEAPDLVAGALYPIMQLGTVIAPVVAAIGIAVFARDRLLAVATLLAGILTWFAAKGVKRMVDRERPLAFLPDLVVREGEGTGLGYISGHAAVAAVTATCAAVAVPPRWRPVLALLAALVGIGRIVHGVHLPADVVGGWSFGTLVGLGTLWLVDRLDARIGVAAAGDGPQP